MKLVLRFKDGRRGIIDEDGSWQGLTTEFVEQIWKPFRPSQFFNDDEIHPEKDTKPGDWDFLINLGFKLRSENGDIEDFWLEEKAEK